ncbi:MAG TPA: T9SS type A sorting domain-containing protein [Chitinophagaceae bacterium]
MKLRILHILFIGSVFLEIPVQAQRLVNTTGNTIGNNNITIEYSVGEIAITTLVGPNNTNYVTQGLLQPTVKITEPSCEIINDTLNFFPNPTENILSVIARSDWITGYHIYATDGKLVRVAPFISNQINMYNLPGGAYFIKLFPGCNNKYRILKVIKQ